MPRLGRFHQAHPQYQLRLDATPDPVDLLQDASVDVAIRYSRERYPALHAACALPEWFGVYGAPARIARAGRRAPALVTVRWRDLDAGMRSTQFYGAAGAGSTIVGGLQDNGTQRLVGAAANSNMVFGGDGGQVQIDPTNTNYVYGEYVWCQVHRSMVACAGSHSAERVGQEACGAMPDVAHSSTRRTSAGAVTIAAVSPIGSDPRVRSIAASMTS